MNKNKKGTRILQIITSIVGVIITIIGFAEKGKAIDSNMFLFGMIIQLFALHIYNSNDLNRLEENKK